MQTLSFFSYGNIAIYSYYFVLYVIIFLIIYANVVIKVMHGQYN